MEILDTVFKHRSIRDFKDETLSEETLETLYKSAIAVSTSTSSQACSIIHVSDPNIKNEVSKVSRQEFIAKAPHLFIFAVDNYRNKSIAEESGVKQTYASSMDLFFQGFSDACIMAQTMALVAQSMGLGICLLGSILNNPERICELLKMPQLTFPAIGLVVGKPSDKVIYQKPRLDFSMRVFENEYKIYDDYLSEIAEYNDEIAQYFIKRNDASSGSQYRNDFVKVVISRLKKDYPSRRKILEFARKQGFEVEL